MPTRVVTLTLAVAALALAGACAGSSLSSQTADLLTSAQCTFQAEHAAAEACRQAFEACLADGGTADPAGCRATLETCLPHPDGGVHRGHGLADWPLDGGPGEGGPHHRGGPGARCEGSDGGMRGPGPEGRFPPVVLPDGAALTACRDALATCLAAAPQDATCFTTARDCERAAFAAAFAAACQSAQASCGTASTDPACAELLERCQEGVDGRPGAFDGGSCP